MPDEFHKVLCLASCEKAQPVTRPFCTAAAVSFVQHSTDFFFFSHCFVFLHGIYLQPVIFKPSELHTGFKLAS